MLTCARSGDWVHLYNSNDPMKPIVAQIYRVWQDKAGKQWINACWYYRPEQTVHRATKHFHKNEVMKTGQYRDHRVDDIEDRCFVMFHTRYHKGRPRGFPTDKSVYICEARYNEQTHVFNRIKTWTSCLPDEVREKDYQMDLYDVPLKVKKELTPIAHLLRPDAKETDPLPKPTTGSKDMPPTVGAVHMRPREPNVSYVLRFVFHSAPLSRTLSVVLGQPPFQFLGNQPQSLIVSESSVRLFCPSLTLRIFLIHPCPARQGTSHGSSIAPHSDA